MCSCVTTLLLTAAVPVVADEVPIGFNRGSVRRRKIYHRSHQRSSETHTNLQVTSSFSSAAAPDFHMLNAHTEASAAAVSAEANSCQLPDIVSSCRRPVQQRPVSLAAAAKPDSSAGGRPRDGTVDLIAVVAPLSEHSSPAYPSCNSELQARLTGAALRCFADRWHEQRCRHRLSSRQRSCWSHVRSSTAADGIRVCVIAAASFIVSVSLYGVWTCIQR